MFVQFKFLHTFVYVSIVVSVTAATVIVLIKCLWENVFIRIRDKPFVEYLDVSIVLLDEVRSVGIGVRHLLLDALLLYGAQLSIFNVEINEPRIVLEHSIYNQSIQLN